MIEISFGKLVVLALIALIVLGPEKLPGAARTAGALLRRVRSGWDNVRAEVERELQVEDIRRTAREAAARAQAAQDELNRTMGRVRGNFSDVPPPASAGTAPAPAEPAPAASTPELGSAQSAERPPAAEAAPASTAGTSAAADTPGHHEESPHGAA